MGLLIITRREQEKIIITRQSPGEPDEVIELVVLETRGNLSRIGIDADRVKYSIDRPDALNHTRKSRR